MGAILSAIDVNKDTSYKLINANPMGKSYRCQLDSNSISINAKPIGAILVCMFQQELNYSLGSNQIEVSISINIFEVYMLQVKVNRRNYNSYLVIYII